MCDDACVRTLCSLLQQICDIVEVFATRHVVEWIYVHAVEYNKEEDTKINVVCDLVAWTVQTIGASQ